jgi:hypothetical protein
MIPGDSSLGAIGEAFIAIVHAAAFLIDQFLFLTYSFRVMTPPTGEGTSFKKNCGPDSWAVMDSVFLNVEDDPSFHVIIPSEDILHFTCKVKDPDHHQPVRFLMYSERTHLICNISDIRKQVNHMEHVRENNLISEKWRWDVLAC